MQRTNTTTNTNRTPQARVTLPNGRPSYVPVWLPAHGQRGRTLALYVPTIGRMPTRRGQ